MTSAFNNRPGGGSGSNTPGRGPTTPMSNGNNPTAKPASKFGSSSRFFSKNSKRGFGIKRNRTNDGGRECPPKKMSKKTFPEGKPWCFANMKFVVSGDFGGLGYTLEQVESTIKKYGGTVQQTVGFMTKYLVVGMRPDPIMVNKVEGRSEKPVTMERFCELLRTLPGKTQPKNKFGQRSVPRSGNKSAKYSMMSSSTAGRGLGTKPTSSSTAGRSLGTKPTSTPKKTDGSGMLWVDKYRPKRIRDLVGNRGPIDRLVKFLRNWDQIKSNKSKKHSCLLSGPPGLGKSSAAHIVAKELGYTVLEFNASDMRGKKAIEEHVLESTSSRSVASFFGGKVAKKKPTCIVMDEIDGMSGSDRGGSRAVIELIKVSKVPLLCICNDRQKQSVRTLSNYCEDLRFKRPTPQDISRRMMVVCKHEGVDVSESVISEIASGVNGDLRQVINILQMWSKDDVSLGDAGGVRARLKSSEKDFTIGTWELPKLMFKLHTIPEKNRIYKGIDYYFTDTALLPLFVQEMYLGSSNRELSLRQNQTKMHNIAAAASMIAYGDVIDGCLRSTQNWQLAPQIGVMMVAAPCMIVKQEIFQVEFPGWFGKNSKRGKNQRLLAALAAQMNRAISGGEQAVCRDYLPLLRYRLTQPMHKQGKDGIPDVIHVMKEYHLDRENWDTITQGEVGLRLQDLYDIDKAVKSAFTRAANAELEAQRSAPKSQRISVMKGLGEEDEEKSEDEEKKPNKKQLFAKDKFIKQKGGPKKKSAAKGKTKKGKGGAKKQRKSKSKKKTKPAKSVVHPFFA